ncbi:Tsf Translation elongation factor Ts [uncultured Caudovirales phage]|uniref:Tsf Translation elongation factor Ts n=1 Tax=uncultured Caudovirales phage TaxID=2100421 RepID=A0A6J5RHK7_9CAUD|nr:Tsf Translation elongation factor Ts [uncultured Caudovirales phage]
MNKSDLIKELRARTQAGMKDCADALNDAGNDLEKAVDILKTKGQNLVSGRDSKVAAEGIVVTKSLGDKFDSVVMAEINCQTDFVARNPDFIKFANLAIDYIGDCILNNKSFDINDPILVEAKNDIVNKTKEKCAIRRWWAEQVPFDTNKTFSYVHPGSKLGVILSLSASSAEIANSNEFKSLGNDLAMQIAAMNPLAISSDRLTKDLVSRQNDIFVTQIKEMNNPKIQPQRVLDGKLNKWYTEVCLLNQESVMFPKTCIKQVIEDVAKKLGGDIQVASFIRCNVGEGIVKIKDDFTSEVSKLSGV